MRVALFLLTNLAVILVASVVFSLLGIGGFITAQGIDYYSLLAFAVIFGFTGSIISLLISKRMALFGTGARIIVNPSNKTEQWLLSTVERLARVAGIGTPDVAIYEGPPNAFATGAFKNSALVGVSTGLLAGMKEDEVEAVLAHEVAHIANGDMVTMTLIQGVVNTFVIFFARVVGFFVDKFLSRDSESKLGAGYFLTVIAFEIAFGILASMIVAWFSRRREFRADAGSVQLMGARQPMINALRRLGNLESGELPKNMATVGINSKSSFFALFRTHPPIEKRIAALQNLNP